MSPDRQLFLNLHRTPARVTIEQASWLLGFGPQEIPVLMRRGLLQPLGNPPPNGPKYFATATISTLSTDPTWLSKASDAIVEYWRGKNDRKSGSKSKVLAPTPSTPRPRARSSTSRRTKK